MKTFDTQLCIRVPKSTLEKIDSIAVITGQSKSDIARWLIEQSPAHNLPSTWTETADFIRETRARAATEMMTLNTSR